MRPRDWSLQIGQQLASFEITSSIGKSGMGDVDRVRDTKLQREVAIKILPDEFSRDPERAPRRCFTAVGAFVLCFVLLAGRVYADSGELDPTFGMGGIVTTDLSGRDDEAKAVAVQSDGKIVVVGSTGEGSGADFAMVRYNMDGSLDMGFGDSGKVTTDFADRRDIASLVAIQADGKIIVAGMASSLNTDFALARYDMNGTLDMTFGAGGKVTTDFGRTATPRVIGIQSDGKLFAGTGSERDFALARYNVDGTPDTTFGNEGKIITDFFGETDWASALLVQSDGKIVVAGIAGTFPRSDFALARYETNGAPDLSFGNGGKVTTSLGRDAGAVALALQPDGKIVAKGFVSTGFEHYVGLARYNTDGTLDVTFGSGGKILTIFGLHNWGGTLALQSDGKIVVAGFDDLGETYDFVLVRYNMDGALDTTFGNGGMVSSPFSGGDNWPNAVAMQSDGKIVVVGYAEGSSDGDFAIARYDSGLPFVSDIRVDPSNVQIGTSFTVSFLGTNLSDQIYFDIRFRGPGSNTDELVLNWQQGRYAGHAIEGGTATGSWTVTGIRAHQEIDMHTGDFVSVPTTLTVTSSIIKGRFQESTAPVILLENWKPTSN